MTKKEEHEKLPDGTEKVHVTKYKYNTQSKIEEIRELMNEDDPNQEDDEKDLITTLTYDTRGNLIGTIDAEGNKISHEYDGFDRKTLTKRYLKNGEEIRKRRCQAKISSPWPRPAPAKLRAMYEELRAMIES